MTATFNSASTVRDTIESVLGQSHPDVEYIIMDGGSHDGTVDIIKEYEPRFNGRLKWESNRDDGMYDAMNKGIAMSAGDVVGIINSDDFYHRNDIIAMVSDAFEEDDCEGVYGDVRFVRRVNTDTTVRYYSSRNFSPGRFRWGFMPAHPSFFTYKRNFERYGYYKNDYHIASDFELLMRFIYTHGLKVKYMPVDFLKMRLGGRSTESWRSTVIINREIVRACRENGVFTCVPMLLLRYLSKIGEFFKSS